MTMVGAAGDSRSGEVPTDLSLPPDDRELLDRLRAGDDAAFGELFGRHGAAVRGYARRCAGAADAEDVAAEAFFRVLLAVRRGHGPADNARGYLLTVVRRVAAECRARRRDVPMPDEDLNRVPEPPVDRAASHAEACLIARAFATLPPRWRTVLWQVEVQGERPATVAEEFGLSVNATAALARRARVGLRAAYLQAHLTSCTGGSSCRAVVDKLGAYTAGSLRGRAIRLVRGHLAGCDSCRALHAELADVCAGLRRYAGQLAPPILGAALPAHGLAAHSVTAHGVAAHGVAAHSVAGHHLAVLAGKAAAVGARVKFAVAAVSMTVVGGVGVAAVPLLIHALPSDQADGVTLDLLPPTVLSTPVSITPSPTGPPAAGRLSAPPGAGSDRRAFTGLPGIPITAAPDAGGMFPADNRQPNAGDQPPGNAHSDAGHANPGHDDRGHGDQQGPAAGRTTTATGYQVFAGPATTEGNGDGNRDGDSGHGSTTATRDPATTSVTPTPPATGRIGRSSKRHAVSPAGRNPTPVPWKHGR